MKYSKSFYDEKMKGWLMSEEFKHYVEVARTSESIRQTRFPYFYVRNNKEDGLQLVLVKLNADKQSVTAFEHYNQDNTNYPIGVYQLRDYKSTPHKEETKEAEPEKKKVESPTSTSTTTVAPVSNHRGRPRKNTANTTGSKK